MCVHTFTVSYSPFPMLVSAISQIEVGGNRRLVCQKAKRTDEVNSGAAVHLDPIIFPRMVYNARLKTPDRGAGRKKI